MTPLLEMRGLRKRYGGRVVFDIPSLTLEAGESYVVMGDNGCGKTTLLRVLAGLEPADAGEYRFEGKPVPLQPYPEWLRRQVIYVHQHPYLFRTSIAHNVAYGLRSRGLSRADCEAKVREAMEWGGVAHLADVPPHRLSGGEKQRVALARVRVLEPKVYLFDEPTANLDQEGRAMTIELIQRLCSANNTVLVACHDHEIIRLPHMHRLHLAGGAIRVEPARGQAEASGDDLVPV
ncbi:MAG: energy-coupling factor ABC transporter ATP-binding protein [Betaproteobacteria bacterium]|nr:energy-coupling factor ABC transporter ATP-binding protein [Betaproteobacteria bacterium]